jgi:hypothetical protein
VDITINGMIDWMSKPEGPIIDHVRECLQRYVVLGYERVIKSMIFTINSIVL